VNEAALNAARYNQKAVRMLDFEFAKDKVLMGRRAPLDDHQRGEKRVTAIHEPVTRCWPSCCRTPIRSTRSRSSRAAWRSV
jgi:hypothetical protein